MFGEDIVLDQPEHSPSPVEDETGVIKSDYESLIEGNRDLAPDSPILGEKYERRPKIIHSLGDIHGWAPGLINYLVHNQLAEISIDGLDLGSYGKINEENLKMLFARSSNNTIDNLPNAGLSGRPMFTKLVNGKGHGNVKARWIGGSDNAFVQVGDIFDRADHSELCCEILRQLVIDAPDRVFVIVGNHEQFFLENDFDNWYLNERRGAVLDYRDDPDTWSGKHLRFIPDDINDTDTKRRDVFKSYSDSAKILFLTQASAQQKSLGINHGLDDKDIDLVLSKGWKPYILASEIWNTYVQETGNYCPGAFSALVIGDTLFHHAEPDEKGLSLIMEEMKSTDSFFSYVTYEYGGNNLRGSPHSPLLWARGASTNSSIGKPNSEQYLVDIARNWPGLFRIVHGHTPTKSIPEFSVEDSCTVSYSGMPNFPPKMNQASKIRVYDIDEGMSPIYYGGQRTDDPTRIPMGLRIVNGNSRRLMKNIIRHSKDDNLLILDPQRNVSTDTRRLWVWGDKESRSNLSNSWEKSNLGFNRITTIDGITWYVATNPDGKELLSRRISNYDLLKNLILKTLTQANIKPRGWKLDDDKTSVEALSVNGKKLLEKFNDENMSLEVAKNLAMVCFGVKYLSNNSAKLYAINGTKRNLKLFCYDKNRKTSSTIFEKETVQLFDIHELPKLVCFSMFDREKQIVDDINLMFGNIPKSFDENDVNRPFIGNNDKRRTGRKPIFKLISTFASISQKQQETTVNSDDSNQQMDNQNPKIIQNVGHINSNFSTQESEISEVPSKKETIVAKEEQKFAPKSDISRENSNDSDEILNSSKNNILNRGKTISNLAPEDREKDNQANAERKNSGSEIQANKSNASTQQEPIAQSKQEKDLVIEGNKENVANTVGSSQKENFPANELESDTTETQLKSEPTKTWATLIKERFGRSDSKGNSPKKRKYKIELTAIEIVEAGDVPSKIMKRKTTKITFFNISYEEGNAIMEFQWRNELGVAFYEGVPINKKNIDHGSLIHINRPRNWPSNNGITAPAWESLMNSQDFHDLIRKKMFQE